MLEQITAIAREAGAIIMAHYEAAKASGIEIVRKADNSPLTAADRDANERIVAGLEQLDPSIPIITEEAALPAYEERADWTRLWLVDPLDGTKEFGKLHDEPNVKTECGPYMFRGQHFIY